MGNVERIKCFKGHWLKPLSGDTKGNVILGCPVCPNGENYYGFVNGELVLRSLSQQRRLEVQTENKKSHSLGKRRKVK